MTRDEIRRKALRAAAAVSLTMGVLGCTAEVDVAGATTGMNPSADLARIFYLQQRILGSTGCTRSELVAMLRMLEATATRPVIDRTMPLTDIHKGFQLMIDGTLTGKVVIHPSAQDNRGSS